MITNFEHSRKTVFAKKLRKLAKTLRNGFGFRWAPRTVNQWSRTSRPPTWPVHPAWRRRRYSTVQIITLYISEQCISCTSGVTEEIAPHKSTDLARTAVLYCTARCIASQTSTVRYSQHSTVQHLEKLELCDNTLTSS